MSHALPMRLRLGAERIFIRTTASRTTHTTELDMDQALQLCTELLAMAEAIRSGDSARQSLDGLINTINRNGAPA